MATVTPKTVVTMNVSGKAASHARTDISVRDVGLVIDEPERLGGTNAGPSPTETFVGSLLGCLNVVSGRIADRIGLTIEDFSATAEAQFDRRGVTMEEAIAVPFPRIDVTIDLRASGSDEAIEQLKADLSKFCPLSMLIRQSGTELTKTWNVTKS